MEARTSYELMGWLNGVSRRYEKAQTKEEADRTIEQWKADRMVDRIDIYEVSGIFHEEMISKRTLTYSPTKGTWAEAYENYSNKKQTNNKKGQNTK
jgi:hypothetical protein